MNTLEHLDKILRKNNARLLIHPCHDANEIVLSIPARIDTDGTIAQYALEYRLGQQFPARTPTPRQDALLDAEFEEIKP